MKAVLSVVSVVVVLLSLMFALTIYKSRNFDPNSVQGKAELLNIARTSKPLIVALAKYYHRNGHFPVHLTDLSPYLSKSDASELNGDSWNQWQYYGTATPIPADITTYGLCITVWSRDPLLRYDYSQSGDAWTYDPGDGSAKIPLPFKVD